MRLGLRLFWLACLLVAPVAPSSAARLGLVIGNDAYVSIDALQNARNDAEAVAATLRELGFDRVEVLRDGDFDAIAGALAELEQRIEPGDTVFLFYAGHGVEIDNRNYLLPVDVPAPREGQEGLVRRKGFAADEIIDAVRARGAATVIAVLDACRDNPFGRSSRRSIGGGRGLAQMTPEPGVFVLFSAGARQAALDRLGDGDPDPNSVFTRVFVDELRRPGADLATIAVETRGKVIDLARSVGHVQTPAYYDQLTRRISLAPGGPGRDDARPVPQPLVSQPSEPPATRRRSLSEKDAFELARSIGTVEAFDAFLAQFPAGGYAAFARAAQSKAREASLPPAPVDPPPMPPATQADPGFVFPDSDRRYLTPADLAGLPASRLRVARNEIFARRGRFFQSADLDRYFRRFPWYRPHSWDVPLNPYEKQNVRILQQAEGGR
jgi:hypothetical protein